MSPGDILGNLDAEKFHSCISLFSEVYPDEEIFAEALEIFFDGELEIEAVNVFDEI